MKAADVIPKGIAPRGKYKQLFGRNELKLTITRMLRVVPADDETLAAGIIAAKGRHADGTLRADVLKRVRDALQLSRGSEPGNLRRTLR